MPKRIFVLVLVAALAATLASAASAIEVRVRIEGATTTLFGAEQPRVTPYTGTLAQGDVTLELSQPTALGALESASRTRRGLLPAPHDLVWPVRRADRPARGR